MTGPQADYEKLVRAVIGATGPVDGRLMVDWARVAHHLVGSPVRRKPITVSDINATAVAGPPVRSSFPSDVLTAEAKESTSVFWRLEGDYVPVTQVVAMSVGLPNSTFGLDFITEDSEGAELWAALKFRAGVYPGDERIAPPRPTVRL